jgi:hypothetical protein
MRFTRPAIGMFDLDVLKNGADVIDLIMGKVSARVTLASLHSFASLRGTLSEGAGLTNAFAWSGALIFQPVLTLSNAILWCRLTPSGLYWHVCYVCEPP